MDHGNANGRSAHCAETDGRFPSGQWVGHFVQLGLTTKQSMFLSFCAALLDGSGTDRVGPFTITGTYRVDSGRVSFCKKYLGQHTVCYDGSAELQHGVWGLWSLDDDGRRSERGGFQLWPLGHESSARFAAKEHLVERIDVELANIAAHVSELAARPRK